MTHTNTNPFESKGISIKEMYELQPGESRNLSQNTINQLKWTIAEMESRLFEDVQDSEVWAYVEDMQAAHEMANWDQGTFGEVTFQDAVGYGISYFTPSTFC